MKAILSTSCVVCGDMFVYEYHHTACIKCREKHGGEIVADCNGNEVEVV